MDKEKFQFQFIRIVYKSLFAVCCSLICNASKATEEMKSSFHTFLVLLPVRSELP
jgi:hypothetical protein